MEFSAYGRNDTDGESNFYIIVVGGVLDASRIRAFSSTVNDVVAINAIVTVDGTQDIQIAWSVTGGSGTTSARTMDIIKLA